MSDPTRPTPRVGSTAADVDGGSPVDRAKAEVQRTKDALAEAKQDIGEAVDQKRGGEATSVDDATSKAASLRDGIERDLATLTSRVPDPADLTDRAKTIGAAVGGGALALGTVVTILRKRGARKAHDKAVREQAVAIAKELARLDLDEIADEVADEEGGGKAKWLLLLAAIAGAGVVAWQRAQVEPTVDDVFGPPGAEDDLGPQGVGAVEPEGDVPPPPPPPLRGV